MSAVISRQGRFSVGGAEGAVWAVGGFDHAAVDATACVQVVDVGLPDGGLVAPTFGWTG